jgi:hypothetical protein
MSCRETSVGSALTSWARLTTGKELSDAAVSATFHRLKHVYLSRPEEDQKQYTLQDYTNFLDRQFNRVYSNTSLSEKEKERIINRLQKAREEDMPENAIMYSLANLVPSVRNRISSQKQFISKISTITEETFEQVAERFELFANERKEDRLPITEENIDYAASLGLARDKGTVNALLKLESEALHFEVAKAKKAPRRIVRQKVQATEEQEYPIVEYGYDSRNTRLEVVAITSEGTQKLYAYTNISPQLASEFAENPNRTWAQKIRGNPIHQYADENQSILAGAAPHCPVCGQFADNTHSCDPRKYPYPVSSRSDNQEQWQRITTPIYYVSMNNEPVEGSVQVPTPAMEYISEALELKRPINISYTEYLSAPNPNSAGYGNIFRDTPCNVSGKVLLIPQEDTVTVDISKLDCECSRFMDTDTCEHTELVKTAFTRFLRNPLSPEEEREARMRSLQEAVHLAETRIERVRLEAEQTNWMNHPQEFLEAQKTWWVQNSDSENVLYSNNIEYFVSDIEKALKNTKPNGAPIIPYFRENVLNGMCTRESGVGFGVEIEYDLPDNIEWRQREQLQEEIGEALYVHNITSSDWMRDAHSSSEDGYADTHTDAYGRGTWSWEEDGSCSGEIVSPLMYDEPETWEKLEKVINILKQHGATATARTGAHVHVGTGMYNGDPRAYTELARLTNQHEDVLYRLAADPVKGTHRRNGYSQPLPRVPKSGFSDVHSLTSWQELTVGRYAVVNFANCTGGVSDHAEFRIFDGTLEPGTMQAQIKLAVATTYAAKRIASEGTDTQRRKEPWGSHIARKPNIFSESLETKTPRELAEDSETTRSFLDTIFNRREDKAHLTAIYTHTSWSVPNQRF